MSKPTTYFSATADTPVYIISANDSLSVFAAPPKTYEMLPYQLQYVLNDTREMVWRLEHRVDTLTMVTMVLFCLVVVSLVKNVWDSFRK